jgi:hypothetical protein
MNNESKGNELSSLTKSQVVWASKHDWYLGTSSLVTGQVCVLVRNDGYADEVLPILVYTDFQLLREWAGY